ncbi:MAG: hypothetical protein QNL33_05980 [Akkermansiaceae bacterium]
MKNINPLFFLLVMAVPSPAANIVWVSDNGTEGNGADGAFHPAVSSGTPYVDQGFVDLLINAGHTVTRYNPDPQGFQDSQTDVATLNDYDLVIVGSAMNSGPFNLNSRGPFWNTAITKPMIVTKSTLIRDSRMGWLKGNVEIDSAADASTTVSGKLTFLKPENPIFQGIAQTGGVMTNFCGIRIPSPTNNRGTSTQLFSSIVDDVDQMITNEVEPGGVVLATIEVNALDPGTNIPAGQAPVVFGNYKTTGYAIAEWPAGTVVRTTQVADEKLGGYRLFFGCGTRDASGSNNSAPNPEAGALDLSEDGQRMFLSAVSRALGHPVPLVALWGQYDKTEIVNGAPGILALRDETKTGFTAAIGEDTLMTDGDPPAVDQAARPRIYQTFSPQLLSSVGQKASLSFKVKFNDVPIVGDTQFRFGLTDTANNQAVLGMIDIGTPAGTTLRMRRDDSITEASTTFVPGDWSHFGNAGATSGSTTGTPNGIGLQDTTTTHAFNLTLERVIGGIQWTTFWTNDVGAATISATTSIVDDSLLPMNVVDGIGFHFFNNAPFGAATTGSFVISDVVVTGEGGAAAAGPAKLEITDIAVSPDFTTTTLTWRSKPGKIYAVDSSTNLAIWDEITDSVPSQGGETAFPAPNPVQVNETLFYRVRELP